MVAVFLFLLAAPWTPLFNGTTPDGWLEVTGRPFPARSWTIEDGSLRALVVDGGYQDIRTRETFREFEFEFEWKIEPGGNSGVKYFIERVDEWKPKAGEGNHARGRGAEYQLVDDERNADALSGPTKVTAALYGKLAPTKHPVHHAGEWNSSRIVVSGGKAQHWLNGELVLEYPHEAQDSFLVLQNHHSATWFRNLRLRRLP
ncbi:MAG: DUF1080 domain-containing protein [Acidobacteria bacterium]|nr:DUF1080 domain-containing protein [Acidobacteriota bacterium]